MSMFSSEKWKQQLADVTPGPDLELVEGRDGHATLKAGNVYLHSRYRPVEEAQRLIESADLDCQRPVLVVGLGLGYHVLELLNRGADVVAVEPDPAVAKLALDGPMSDTDILLGVGDPDEILATEEFQRFAARLPQILVHPPTAKLHPGFAEEFARKASTQALSGKRLNIAVVGPMYGGSLPIARYLERAFNKLGHTTRLVDNSIAWDLYRTATETSKSMKASKQLGAVLANFLNEWCYSRVSEFDADICIVLAQAPVNDSFPVRMAKEKIVTAFWFVENWRHMPYWREVAPNYDYFFHMQPGEFEKRLEQIGCNNHAFIQTGCDPDVHKPVDLSDENRAEFECDLSFAGAGYNNRIQVFQGLTDYDFKLWGVEWNSQQLKKLVCNPGTRFTPEDFAKIAAASKINLNLHSSATHDGVDPTCDAINPRVFEIAACGGFQLCDPCKNLDKFFDLESELPTYKDLRELRSKIDHYLEHPEERKEIAEKARKRALKDHTYEKRAQQMLDLILEEYGTRILRKGIRVQHTMEEAASRIGPDTELGKYLGSLPADLPFTQENINDQLTSATTTLTYPEKVFVYLREMRNFAQMLFEVEEK